MTGLRSLIPALAIMAGCAAAAPCQAQAFVYLSHARTHASTPTVPVSGFGLSIGRLWVFGYEDLRGTGTRLDSPYGDAIYCDEAGLCLPQQTRVFQGFRRFYIGRRYALGALHGTEISVMPRMAASFVRETRDGLDAPGAVSGNQGSITAGVAVEATRAVSGPWAVTLFGTALRQIREPSKCTDCYTPLRTGFSQAQLSLGVTRRTK
ncbi:MAG: hypothetical protein ABIV28_08830 [Longimicrobiales bacterium]